MPRYSPYRGASMTPTLASETTQKDLNRKAGASVLFIPRPKQDAKAVFANGAVRPALQDQMYTTRTVLIEITANMRNALKKHVDPGRPFLQQKRKAVEAYVAECSKLPRLRRNKHAGSPSASRTQQKDEGPPEEQVPTTEPPAQKSPAEQPMSPRPTKLTDSQRPAAGASGSSQVPSLAEFFAVLHPPEPGLLQVLKSAGVRKWAELARLAEDEYMLHEFLYPLVLQNKLSHYQSTLLKSEMRRVFLCGASKD